MKIKEDLTNRQFGRLTVLSRDLTKIGMERGSFWTCECVCGIIKSVSRHALVNHGTQSCGCLQKEKARNASLPSAGADKNYWLSKYKKRALKNGIEFTISKEEFFDICGKNCFYCDAPAAPKSHGYKRADKSVYSANGIDRVNPNIGYVFDNCVPCCKICNFMKTDKTQSEFINKITEIFQNTRKLNVTP